MPDRSEHVDQMQETPTGYTIPSPTLEAIERALQRIAQPAERQHQVRPGSRAKGERFGAPEE
jgi:hypothetical protein